MDPMGPAVAPLPPDASALLDHIDDDAARTDAEGVQRSTIDALARAGLLGAPLEPPSQQRELAERLAMADGSVWFSWTQHFGCMRTLASAQVSELSPNARGMQDRWLAGLSTGAYLGALAFAHVRRPGPPNPLATRTEGGWVVNGRLDWVTSWDIADVVMIMVRGSGEWADHFITFYLPAGHSDSSPLAGMEVGEPLRLLAMGGTHTRPITFTDVVIPDACVTSVQSVDAWRERDDRTTSDAGPAIFGVVRGAVAELVGASRSNEATELAEEITSVGRSLRASAYALADADGDPEVRREVRAASLDLAARAAQAVVVARSGGAMVTGTSAERRVREAMFLQVQAQTADVRAAQLRLIRTGVGLDSAAPAAVSMRTTHE
ncbi:MAG: acyl-CoA dehydrogenase [Actinobacteria bacterium]|nr:acyl-CoA dehydrogenase [Actinomycetota bacterium]